MKICEGKREEIVNGQCRPENPKQTLEKTLEEKTLKKKPLKTIPQTILLPAPTAAIKS